MKILIDECLPTELKGTLTAMGHECQTARQSGFGSKKNGELLSIAEGRWDVLLTSDRNIRYQQNMTGRNVSIVILRAKSNRMKDLFAADARLRSIPSYHPTRPSDRRWSPLAEC
jgi:predicted nuclease of predicted toxin-antitoxin system